MNRLSRTAFVGAVALGSVPVVGLAPAYACDCAMTDDAGHREHSDVVFRGRLVQGAGEQTSPEGHFVLAFRADRAYKGDVERRVEIGTEQQGAACGLILTEPGPYLVFAFRPEKGSYAAGPGEPELFANSCGGTRPILPGEQPFGRGRPVAAVGEDGRDGRDGGSRPTTAVAVLDVLRDLLGWLTPAVAHVLDAAERATALVAGPAKD